MHSHKQQLSPGILGLDEAQAPVVLQHCSMRRCGLKPIISPPATICCTSGSGSSHKQHKRCCC